MDELVQKKYAFRQFLLNHYDKLAGLKEKDPKSVKLEAGKIKRFRNIVNQTDPEELFESFSEKELDRYLSGEAAISSKPPDKRVFDRVRVLLEGDLHHAIELDRNIDVIPDRWDNDQLYEFHQTVKQAKMQPGSAAGNLPELRKIDHDPQGLDNTPENRARSAHNLGTKNTRFKYEEIDPKMRAAEMIMYNEAADYRIRQIEMDPERTSFKAFEEANRIDIEQGGKGFERRVARKSPVTQFKTEMTFNQNASERLRAVTGMGLNGLPKGAIKAGLLGTAIAAPGIVSLPLSVKAAEQSEQEAQQNPTLINKGIALADKAAVAGDTLDVAGMGTAATGIGAVPGALMSLIGGGISNVASGISFGLDGINGWERSIKKLKERTGDDNPSLFGL